MHAFHLLSFLSFKEVSSEIICLLPFNLLRQDYTGNVRINDALFSV